MRILAFDQASRTSGWAFFDNNKLITFGKFTYDDSDFGDRLLKIRNKVKALITEYHPDKIIFEDIQLQSNVGNNVDTFKKLAEVFGVICELFAELKIPSMAVISTVWKSALGIKGKDRAAQKKNAQIWVQEKYNITPTQDECDAICIGTYGCLNIPSSDTVFDWSE